MELHPGCLPARSSLPTLLRDQALVPKIRNLTAEYWLREQTVRSVRTVSQGEFENSFAFYKECASSEYAGVHRLTHQLVERFQHKEIDMLLIGPGTGDFENEVVNDVLSAHNVTLRSVIAYEPNKAHVPVLRRVMLQWNCVAEVHAECFDETSNLSGKEFDVAIFAHSRYLTSENIRGPLMKNTLNALKPDGCIAVYTQAESDDRGMDQFVEFVRHFNKRLDFGCAAPYANHDITAESMQLEFSTAIPGSRWSVQRVPANVDVTCVLEDPFGDDALELVTFILSTPAKFIPLDLWQQMTSWIATAASGANTIRHPSALVIGEPGQA